MTKEKTYIIEEKKTDWRYIIHIIVFFLAGLLGSYGTVEAEKYDLVASLLVSSIFMAMGAVGILFSLIELATNKKTVEKEVKVKEVKNGSKKTKKRV